MAIAPFKALDGEKFGVSDPGKGQRRCIVIVPRHPAEGNPWSWRGCYWNHQPQAEIALLNRGFHVAHVCSSDDPSLNDNTRILETKYKELGGRITVIIKEGQGHYPTAPIDPKPIVEFIPDSIK